MRTIFVFGSNLAGIHGKGAALHALNHHGAIYGRGIGRQGSSYAIPTKDTKLKPLPLPVIQFYVNRFIRYAESKSKLRFKLTAIGTGLAGYKPSQIAPMFKAAPENVTIPPEFTGYL